MDIDVQVEHPPIVLKETEDAQHGIIEVAKTGGKIRSRMMHAPCGREDEVHILSLQDIRPDECTSDHQAMVVEAPPIDRTLHGA